MVICTPYLFAIIPTIVNTSECWQSRPWDEGQAISMVCNTLEHCKDHSWERQPYLPPTAAQFRRLQASTGKQVKEASMGKEKAAIITDSRTIEKDKAGAIVGKFY